MPGLLDINTPGGQQILYDFVNWHISGQLPVAPIGNVDYYNTYPKLFHVLEAGSFRTAAQKIAPIAIGAMSDHIFNMLLGRLEGRSKRDLRKLLKKIRKENYCVGLEIKPPCPHRHDYFDAFEESGKSNDSGETKIDALNRYTRAGRRLMMDFIDHENTGFHPTVKPGCVEHYLFRKEYSQHTSKSAFRSQAMKIAKDVACHAPDANAMRKIFEDVRLDFAQPKKLRSYKQKEE